MMTDKEIQESFNAAYKWQCNDTYELEICCARENELADLERITKYKTEEKRYWVRIGKNYEQWFWRLWFPHGAEEKKHKYALYLLTESGMKGLITRVWDRVIACLFMTSIWCALLRFFQIF